jgi:hypothetical protein
LRASAIFAMMKVGHALGKGEKPLRSERMIRIGVLAASVASCAHDAPIGVSPSPIPSPPPCVTCASPTPAQSKPEVSEGNPRVESVDPTQGTTAGGEEIFILGGGFSPGTGAEVRIGRKKSPAATIVSTNRIRVVTPPSNEGQADVMVMFEDGSVFKIPNGFRYVEP